MVAMPVVPATQKLSQENHLNLEEEVAVSRDHASALQPGDSQTPSQKQTNKKERGVC